MKKVAACLAFLIFSSSVFAVQNTVHGGGETVCNEFAPQDDFKRTADIQWVVGYLDALNSTVKDVDAMKHSSEEQVGYLILYYCSKFPLARLVDAAKEIHDKNLSQERK